MPSAAIATATAISNSTCSSSSEEPQDLFALVPTDVAAYVLVCAGGPAALQATRSTSAAWKAVLDSLVVSAACSSLPHAPSSCSPCAALLALPRLHTVDFSSCCQPVPAGQLAGMFEELSHLPHLEALKLSTWCLVVATQQAQQAEQQPPGLRAVSRPHSKTSASPLHHVVVPRELGRITRLRRLVIGHCAEVSPPAASRSELTPAVMQLTRLTSLEQHGFLPAVHHLKGMKHLQHLTLCAGAGLAAANAAGAQNMAVINAAMAAVLSAQELRSLHVQLTPGTTSPLLSDHGSGALISLLCEAGTDPARQQQGSHPSPGSSSVSGSGAGPAGSSSSCSCPAATAAPAQAARGLRQFSLVAAGGLYHIPARFGVACAGLQQLDLSRNELSAAAAAVLGGLSHLTSLCLSECGLTDMPASWTKLTQLQVLNVSGNVIGALPAFFSRLRALHKLVLSSTHLLALPAFVSCLTGLEHLDLASNNLQDIPPELCSCVRLRHLDVSKNRLLALPDSFSRLSHITQLNLTGNHLEVVPSGLHNLAHLSHLGLALNYYKTWRQALPCFASLASSLQELELQHTATVLDDAAGFLEALGQLTALTSLCAGSNQLSDLPQAWQQLKHLKVLQLSHNAMEALPISLLSLTALTYLDLSYNRIMSLPFWVGSRQLQQLRRLNLAKNHLTTLPLEMSRLSALTQLQLQGNNLAGVPPCLGQLLQLRVLNIGGNYKLKEGGLGQQLAAIASLRDVVLPYRLADAAAELRRAGKAVQLD